MEFLPKNIAEYAEQHSSKEPKLLSTLNRDTYANVLAPRMLSGHLQGRVLSLFSKMARPEAILEIGTYTGYSALCLAEGLTENGVLHTIDINEELETRINKFVSDSSYKDKIKLHIGNALDIVPTLKESFDLVFIDADKDNYGAYYDLLIDKLPSGAIIIADNVLWSGKVIDANQLTSDKDTIALDKFNKQIQEDSRVENILMPIRDGLMVIRKK
ncbi:O-methyltransferase [Bacteroidia bacterium]|nr:O-methyltransferase [Bacteroidia bacterium]MDB4107810.1 O-methyltransferase [Bacteroidia bacterium]MDB9882388.1 O-methyltransferase [Bacteroidia bacterium]